MSITLFAAIYVGSYEVSLKIMEISKKKGIREIDHIRSRIGIGRNIYQQKKVETEVMEELCEILSEYSQIIKSYRADACRAYAGAFLKEAQNALFVIEQIRIRTGFQVQILSNSERRFLSYQSMTAREEFEEMAQKGAAVVDVGGESIQITLFVEGGVVTTQHLVLGTLRLKEQLSEIGHFTLRLEKQMEELINKEIEVFKSMYLKKKEVHYLILLGDYISEVINGVQKGGITVETDVLTEYLKRLEKTDVEEVAEELGLAHADPLLIPSVVMYGCMVGGLGTKEIWVPGNDISDGIAYQYARERKLLTSVHDFEKDVMSAATNLSKRYRSYSPHLDALTEMSSMIFDAIKKIHGMGNRERLLLRAAAVVHDCGKFVSLANGAECTYNIIMASEIIGLTHLEREIVARAVLYHTKPMDPYEDVVDKLDVESYMTATKLAAILRVANALDRSHKQKFKIVRISLKKKELLITVETEDDIVLEKGLLAKRSDSFKAIFGIKPILREKKSF
ncbi:MAG: HD domain-containing protein [Lachnospiraceae bacterium]|nr:HD domain-containing protein [Lachnospiraceae bacterium]